MTTIAALLLLMLVVKVVLDSPVGTALAEAIRHRSRESGGVSAPTEQMERLQRDVEELRDRVDRVVQEQAFLTELLLEPKRPELGPGRESS